MTEMPENEYGELAVDLEEVYDDPDMWEDYAGA